MACVLAAGFTLPIGVITATTNQVRLVDLDGLTRWVIALHVSLINMVFSCTFQTPGLNILTEYIMGYILPGRPLANVCFKVYGYMSMSQAISFLSDFKLGHYMKVPPRSMFVVQVCSKNSH